MLKFKSIGTYRSGNNDIYYVENPYECNNFDHIKGKKVQVDGQYCRVENVERFVHCPPWRKGEHIGLWTEKKELLEFKSFKNYPGLKGTRFFRIENPYTYDNFDSLIGETVKIDDKYIQIINVEWKSGFLSRGGAEFVLGGHIIENKKIRVILDLTEEQADDLSEGVHLLTQGFSMDAETELERLLDNAIEEAKMRNVDRDRYYRRDKKE